MRIKNITNKIRQQIRNNKIFFIFLFLIGLFQTADNLKAQENIVVRPVTTMGLGRLYIERRDSDIQYEKILEYIQFYLLKKHPKHENKIYFIEDMFSVSKLDDDCDYRNSNHYNVYKSDYTVSKSLLRNNSRHECRFYFLSINYNGFKNNLSLYRTAEEMREYDDYFPALKITINPTNIAETLALLEFALKQEKTLCERFYKINAKGVEEITIEDEKLMIITGGKLEKAISRHKWKVNCFLKKYPFENAKFKYIENAVQYEK